QIKVEVPVTDNDLYPEWVGGGSDSRKPPQIRVIQVPVAGGAGSRQMEKRTMTVAEARQKLVQVHLDRMIDSDMILASAIRSTEQEGIVFVDEIDKICNSSKGFYHGSDASSEGVQRDLLPILEGSDVSTKHGNVNTDHILFICSGAFHSVKPGDMLAELQGRLPVRVTLSALTEHDFVRILTEPHHNLIEQHKLKKEIVHAPRLDGSVSPIQRLFVVVQALLQTEGITLDFPEDGIKEIARIAFDLNTHVENIGARRLHTVMEKIMEEVSFDAPTMGDGTTVTVDAEMVRTKLKPLLSKGDLHKFIL
ncbi:hypothetical protein FOZ62_022886, partial [Perkinsus olseni]